MRQLISSLLAAGTLFFTGCNAVYFYETDKVSLTVEVRPDSTGPIQGNFGLKQRVVAFVPKRNGARPASRPATSDQRPEDVAKAEADAKNGQLATLSGAAVKKWQEDFRDSLADQSSSDALDVLSSLRFHKLPKPEGAPWYQVSHMTIDSALITGGAARHVVDPSSAIGALSGTTQRPQSLADIAAIQTIYDSLTRTSPSDLDAKERQRDLDDLARLLPEKYPIDFYSLDTTNAALPKLDIPHHAGDAVTRDDFNSVIVYWAALAKSIQGLDDVSRRSTSFSFGGVAVPAEHLADVQRGMQQREAEALAQRDHFLKTIVHSPAIRSALTHFTSKF